MKNFWDSLSLNKKIILIIIAITLMTTITILPAVFFTIRDRMLWQQRSHLRGIRNLVEGLIEDNHRAIRNYAVLFSANREVRDNLFYHTELAGERDHPLNAIQHLVDAFDVRFIELCDRKGRVIANTEYPEMYDIDRSSNPLILTALSGTLSYGIEEQQQGFLLMAVSPIYYDENQLIGTITTGVVMDDNFAERIKELSGVEIAITDMKDNIIASTLSSLSKGDSLNADEEELNLDEKMYLPIRISLSDQSDFPFGNVVIMMENTLPQIMRNAHITVTVLLSLIAIASITATVMILRRVLEPVQDLKRGAEKIGSGDFHQRIEVTSRDEIGSLAEVFNQMAENLLKMREMEEKLQHSERLASIGKFTAGIAHEINNPIANIIGLLKLIKRDTPEGDPLREEFEIVIKEASRCGAIVRDLLLYSRQSSLKMQTINANGIIEETIQSISHSLDGKDITVIKDFDEALPSVHADPFQIEQVIRNVLLNAVQSIEQKGQVIIQTTRRDNATLEIMIKDTGCGIGKEEIDKVFYPFFTTKRTGEGIGLGLTVSYGIIQSHGGDIAVESEEGKGSTFRISLPIEDNIE